MFNGNYDAPPTEKAEANLTFSWRRCRYGGNKPAPNAKKRAARQRGSGRALLTVSLAPWLNLAAWTIYAEAARMALGHFPHYMIENAPSFVDEMFGSLAGLCSLMLVLSVPTWTGLLLWRTSQWKDKTLGRAAIVYGLGWAVTILVCWLDPVGFVN